jgi:hypothetical protein
MCNFFSIFSRRAGREEKGGRQQRRATAAAPGGGDHRADRRRSSLLDPRAAPPSSLSTFFWTRIKTPSQFCPSWNLSEPQTRTPPVRAPSLPFVTPPHLPGRVRLCPSQMQRPAAATRAPVALLRSRLGGATLPLFPCSRRAGLLQTPFFAPRQPGDQVRREEERGGEVATPLFFFFGLPLSPLSLTRSPIHQTPQSRNLRTANPLVRPPRATPGHSSSSSGGDQGRSPTPNSASGGGLGPASSSSPPPPPPPRGSNGSSSSSSSSSASPQPPPAVDLTADNAWVNNWAGFPRLHELQQQQQSPQSPSPAPAAADDENDDDNDDFLFALGGWGDGQASSSVAAAQAAAEAAAAAAVAAAEAAEEAAAADASPPPSALSREAIATGGLTPALPASALFETAFFAADRDGDGRLTRGEAASLLAYAMAASGAMGRRAAAASRRRARAAGGERTVGEAEAAANAALAALAAAAAGAPAAPSPPSFAPPPPPLAAPPPPPPPPLVPKTWDQHLVAEWRRASVAARGGVAGAALRFAGRALAGRAHERDDDDEDEREEASPSSSSTHPRSQQQRLLLSDIVWSAFFAGVAVAGLGAFAAAAPTLPLVGQWHRPAAAAALAAAAGASPAAAMPPPAAATLPLLLIPHPPPQPLPLLLSSFGAICVLLFARPESEALRLWPVVAGQAAGAGLALACLTLLGPGLWARALGMAAVVGFMLWADCAHPPGGALCLFAMDHWAALQHAAAGGAGAAAAGGVGASAAAGVGAWFFCLWPSLALTLGLLMPLGWLCNHMKRTAKFDWPRGSAGGGDRQQEQQQQQQQQQPQEHESSPEARALAAAAADAAEAARRRGGGGVGGSGSEAPSTPLPPRPATPSPGYGSGSSSVDAGDAEPRVRRRFYVRSSDGGGWIEDMT